MSVPIIYDSCLSDEALDAAIADFNRVTSENQKLHRELENHDADQNAKLDAAIAAGETYTKEEKEIEELEFAPFNVMQKKFVICVDTMGQDCEISNEQRRQVLETISIFREQWERAEVQCLTQDRDRRIELAQRDPSIETELNEKVTEIIGKAVEDLLAIEQPEGVEPKDEETKQIDLSLVRLTTQVQMFKAPEGILHECIAEIAHFHVIKMPRIIQSLMFLMQIDHDAICEPDSNRLFWKHAKKHITDMCRKMTDYKILGMKESEFKGFQTINYCEKLINDYTQEEVDLYHPGFGKLFKWLMAVIALRK